MDLLNQTVKQMQIETTCTYFQEQVRLIKAKDDRATITTNWKIFPKGAHNHGGDH